MAGIDEFGSSPYHGWFFIPPILFAQSQRGQQLQKLILDVRILTPGVLLAAVIALAASYLSDHYGGPAMLFALLLGMAFNYLAESATTGPGVRFCSRSILRFGVALLGTRITWAEVQGLGIETVWLVVAAVATTVVLGSLIARLIGLQRNFAILTAGAVAICGASAALAISSVLKSDKDSERHTITTVIGITTLSTIAMMVYPLLSALMELDDKSAGIFIGATVHDVAQVVGAGYSISTEAGDTSAVVKLLRVSCLLPVVAIVGFMSRETGTSGEQRPPLLPFFLIAFAGLVLVNSLGWINPGVASTARGLSSWCLLTAVSALGVRTSLGELAAVGPRPLLALVSQTLLIAVIVAGAILLR